MHTVEIKEFEDKFTVGTEITLVEEVLVVVELVYDEGVVDVDADVLPVFNVFWEPEVEVFDEIEGNTITEAELLAEDEDDDDVFVFTEAEGVDVGDTAGVGAGVDMVAEIDAL